MALFLHHNRKIHGTIKDTWGSIECTSLQTHGRIFVVFRSWFLKTTFQFQPIKSRRDGTHTLLKKKIILQKKIISQKKKFKVYMYHLYVI